MTKIHPGSGATNFLDLELSSLYTLLWSSTDTYFSAHSSSSQKGYSTKPAFIIIPWSFIMKSFLKDWIHVKCAQLTTQPVSWHSTSSSDRYCNLSTIRDCLLYSLPCLVNHSKWQPLGGHQISMRAYLLRKSFIWQSIPLTFKCGEIEC